MQVVGVGRALWLTGLLAVCALSLVLNLRWAVSGAYVHFAQVQLRFDDNRPAVRQAARLAQELDFRNAQALQLQAQNDLNAGQIGTALVEYQQALQLAPADAFCGETMPWRDLRQGITT